MRRSSRETVDGEQFALATGASDIERYDVLRDIMRLERLVETGVVDAGCTIVLTNSPAFWSAPAGDRPTGYDNFRIHDGVTLEGVLHWGPTAGAGTRRGREEPIGLRGAYRCAWRLYTRVGTGGGRELRYLTVIIS